MKAGSILAWIIFLLLSSVIVFAQRPGGGGGQGRRGGGAGVRVAQGAGPSSQVQRDRLHSQVTATQRDQYRACDQSLDQLRSRVRDLSRSAVRTSLDFADARRQHDQIRDRFQRAVQDRAQLQLSLNQDQHTAIQPRLRNLLRLEERIQTRLNHIDQELSQPDPNRDRLAQEARLTEREMQDYRLHFQHMGDDLGLSLD